MLLQETPALMRETKIPDFVGLAFLCAAVRPGKVPVPVTTLSFFIAERLAFACLLDSTIVKSALTGGAVTVSVKSGVSIG